MKTVTVTADHLKMTSWNVMVVVIFVLFLLLATLMVTNPPQSRGAAGEPLDDQEHTSTILREPSSLVAAYELIEVS